MNNLLLMALIGLPLLVGYGLWLWRIARSRTPNKILFFVILSIPYVIPLLMSFINNGVILTGAYFIGVLLFSFFLGVYMFFYGEALWDAAGHEKTAWFILMLLFSPLFFLFRVTER